MRRKKYFDQDFLKWEIFFLCIKRFLPLQQRVCIVNINAAGFVLLLPHLISLRQYLFAEAVLKSYSKQFTITEDIGMSKFTYFP